MASATATMNAAQAKAQYVGHSINELPTPSAIIDRRVAASHCARMLASCRELEVGFRAHIKTHKTAECSKLQVGETGDIRLIVSTLPEIAILLPWLQEEQRKGRSVSVLYSMPLPPSAIPMLDKYAATLGSSGSIAVMLDHPDQIAMLARFTNPPTFFLKLDTGTHRAGLPPDSPGFAALADAALAAHRAGTGRLHGLYSHASHSYKGTDAARAMDALAGELDGCATAATVLLSRADAHALDTPLMLSVGATPSATAAQNLCTGLQTITGPAAAAAAQLRASFARLAAMPNTHIELHAGVYPFLDLQQLSTQAAPSSLAPPQEAGSSIAAPLGPQDVAFTVLAEVASIYQARTPPQALVAAGSLALGREPCPRYRGFGAVSTWGLRPEQVRAKARSSPWCGDGRSGWVVGSISQEHGLLFPEEASAWETKENETEMDSGKPIVEVPFVVGQKVRILPNHACIAGAGYSWYYVVDGGDTVVDVWERCRGWQS